MATQISQRRHLPRQERVFEVSRLHEDFQAEAYALLVPNRASVSPTRTLLSQRWEEEPDSAGIGSTVKGGRTA
jgi:hypothetical protein